MLWSVFKYFDVDNSNEITVANLKEAMIRLGKDISEQELSKYIMEYTNNGKMHFDNFKKMMQSDYPDLKSELISMSSGDL